MVSSILPLKVVHMWYKVWTWSQTRSHSGHFQVGIQNPSISRSELKIIIDQKWYTWEKNVVNTINSPYKKADLKKKFGCKSDFVWFLHLQRRANRSRWLAVKDLCKLENHCSFVCAEKSSNEEVGKDYIASCNQPPGLPHALRAIRTRLPDRVMTTDGP